MYNVTEKQIKIDERIQAVAVIFISLLLLGMTVGFSVLLVSSALAFEPNEAAAPIAIKISYAFFVVEGLFLLLCFVICACLFVAGIHNSLYVYVFDQLGVSRISPFRTKFIAWEDVKDYGISFEYTRRSSHFFIDIGKSYSFYVSDKVCPQKNYSKKDLSGVFFILSFNLGYQKHTGYFEARKQGEHVRQMLAFCAEHTDVQPFIASNATGLLDPVLESPSDKLKEKFRPKK